MRHRAGGNSRSRDSVIEGDSKAQKVQSPIDLLDTADGLAGRLLVRSPLPSSSSVLFLFFGILPVTADAPESRPTRFVVNAVRDDEEEDEAVPS